jgi:hypothetical protein
LLIRHYETFNFKATDEATVSNCEAIDASDRQYYGMANSNLPEGLANQVSSESLDTFLNDLPTEADLEDLAMDQHSCDEQSNVKHPATMMLSSTVSINNEPQDVNDAEGSREVAHPAVAGPNNADGVGNAIVNGRPAIDHAPPLPRHIGTAASATLSAAPIMSGTVPEFLYQLFKMLTDNNREVIEWADGKY